MNKQLEAAKQEWWDAKSRNDEKAMAAAAAKGSGLRDAGAVESTAAKALDAANNEKLKAGTLTPSPSTVPAASASVKPAPVSTPAASTQQTTTPAKPPASTTTTSSSYTKPSQDELNKQLEAAKTEWWDAKFRNDEKAMEAAASKGNTLRAAGAVETEKAKALDAANGAKLQQSNQEKLNQELLQAKESYWTAKQTGDSKGMAEAELRGIELREKGAVETSSSRKLDQDNLNTLLFGAKRQWWDARMKDDANGMESAKAQGDMYRSMGAVETDEMRKFDSEQQRLYDAQKSEREALAAAELKKKEEALRAQKQELLDKQLLQTKEQWWIARLNSGNRPEEIESLNQLKLAADKLREQGAKDTAATDALNQRYQVQLDEKLAGERQLLQEKKNWWNAYLNLDQAGMNLAAQAASKLRENKYVKNTAEMDVLETQNQLFLKAKQSFYEQQVQLSLSGMSDARAKMDAATANGASLSRHTLYELDYANKDIIRYRVAYWNTRADEGYNAAQVHKAEEEAFRQKQPLTSLLLSRSANDTDTELGRVANEAIWRSAERWNAYADKAKKELSELSSADAVIKELHHKLDTALNGYTVFKETKTDTVNELLVGLRSQYWQAADRNQSTLMNDLQKQIQSTLKAHKDLAGLLENTQQERNNREFLTLRSALNKDIANKQFDAAIQKMTALQEFLTEKGSDLIIRSDAQVSETRVGEFMLHLKEKEWDAYVQLRTPDAAIGKVKATLKGHYPFTEEWLKKAEALDQANRNVLHAKREFWSAITNRASFSTLENAYKNVQSKANISQATLDASMNTAFDRIFQQAITYKIQLWTEKGIKSKQDDVYQIGLNVNTLNNKAHSLGLDPYVSGFVFGAGESGTTSLDRKLMEIYEDKKLLWEKKAAGSDDTDLENKVNTSISDINNVLRTANNHLSTDLKLPSFALDAANEKVLFARDQVLDAIRRGDRSKAEYFNQVGLSQANYGATLNMQELSPDLTRVSWHVKRWEQQMRDTVEQYNRELDEGKASREDVKSMQQSLKNLGLYDGGVTGKYDESFLYAVTSFQQLSMLGEIASRTKEVNIPYVDGKVTSNLASAAKGAYFKNRELASLAEVSVGIREGYNQWREDQAHQIADAAINFNPFDKEFWSTTIEELGALAKAFAKGEITKDDIVLSVAMNEWEELKKSAARVEDIWHLATKVVNKTITFDESKQLGAYVAEAEMALSVVVGTWGTGALASKLSKIAPRILENLKAVGKEHLDSRKDKVDGPIDLSHPNGTPMPTHNAKGERIDNVEVPKVKRPASYEEFIIQEKKAIEMYKGFVAINTDIGKIAKNTGWKESDILQIKNHLFINLHKFDNGEERKFDPDYQQALAWKRLNDGNFNKHDILLLNHELFELNFMKNNSVTYETAHKQANLYYNWDAAIHE